MASVVTSVPPPSLHPLPLSPSKKIPVPHLPPPGEHFSPLSRRSLSRVPAHVHPLPAELTHPPLEDTGGRERGPAVQESSKARHEKLRAVAISIPLLFFRGLHIQVQGLICHQGHGWLCQKAERLSVLPALCCVCICLPSKPSFKNLHIASCEIGRPGLKGPHFSSDYRKSIAAVSVNHCAHHKICIIHRARKSRKTNQTDSTPLPIHK